MCIGLLLRPEGDGRQQHFDAQGGLGLPFQRAWRMNTTLKRMLGRSVVAVLFGAWCGVWTGTSAAQTNTAEIAGVARDAQGGVLAGVTVTAVHEETGASVQGVTDDQGRYLLASLRVGRYTVTTERTGFARIVRPGVELEVGQMLRLDVVLDVGGLAEDITVTADVGLLQPTSAEISDVISRREVAQIPLNGRNFLSLAQLSDAVIIPPGGTRGDALQQAGPLPNVGGQRSGHNIYLLDGVKVTDELFNNLVINPSVDSIQEFKIQKSQYAAEFGGKASALINVVTRAGSNRAQGTIFEFARHDRFDAHNYFDPRHEPVPPLRQHQFGGALGGPIVRGRAFYFASVEGQRARRSLTRTFTVPTAAARTGDFSGLAPICDPETYNVTTGACAPFEGNRIPAGRLDPIASAFLSRVPLPTTTSSLQNLTSIEPQVKDGAQMSLRLDYTLSSRDQVFGRFSTFDADEVQPFGTSALQESLVAGFGRSVSTTARNIGISHTHVFGTSALNEVRIGWLRTRGGQVSLNEGVDFAGQVGLEGVTRDPRDVGFPQISTRGVYSTMGDPTSFVFRDNEHIEVYDSVLLSRGAHRVKLGGYVYHLKLRPTQPDNARGAFTYTGQFSGNAFADFLLGYPASAVSGIGRGDEDGRTNWVHAFAQDDWRVGDNLTLNLGLRYEYNQHMRAVDNRLSSIDLTVPGGRFVIASDESGRIDESAAAMLPLLPLPYTTSAGAGWDRGLLRPSKVRLAPRTGFALSLVDGRTVVRGGYGVFLNQWAYSVQTAFARNLPFFYTRQVDVPADQRRPTFQTRNVLSADPTGAVGANIMDHDYAVEYTQTWSGGLQHALRASTMVELSYMGSWTLGADNPMLRNVPGPGTGPIQARRPIPALGLVRSIRFDGKSTYHGATVRAEHRPRSGSSFTVSYTLSTSRDDASSPGATEAETNVPQDASNIFDETGEWARSSFDHRHQFVASATYALPSFSAPRALTRAILGDWRVNAVFTAQSGAPFTVNLGVDHANVGTGPAQRPNSVGDPNLPGGQRTPERWFDTSAFALPSVMTFGNARRNSVVGPGYSTLDVAMSRTWPVGASSRIEFRWEIFNAVNRANFDLPNRIFGTPNLGRIFSAKPPREMQFGLRWSF
jgi:hypothetical protein